MNDRSPFFSIIIVSYNASGLILKTIKSVLSQTYSNFEIVVKDALSTDDTLLYIPADKRIHVYSTRDTGIYAGMNEAIDYCSGEYICFLNCGDKFADEDVLKNVALKIRGLKLMPDLIYGDMRYNKQEISYPEKITDFYLFRNTLCHQASFFNRRVFAKYGKYREDYRISADREYFTRLYFQGALTIHINRIICEFLPGGLSETEQGKRAGNIENKNTLRIYYGLGKRAIYSVVIVFSMKRFRIWIANSDRAPQFLKKIYNNIRKQVNQ